VELSSIILESKTGWGEGSSKWKPFAEGVYLELDIGDLEMNKRSDNE